MTAATTNCAERASSLNSWASGLAFCRNSICSNSVRRPASGRSNNIKHRIFNQRAAQLRASSTSNLTLCAGTTVEIACLYTIWLTVLRNSTTNWSKDSICPCNLILLTKKSTPAHALCVMHSDTGLEDFHALTFGLLAAPPRRLFAGA